MTKHSSNVTCYERDAQPLQPTGHHVNLYGHPILFVYLSQTCTVWKQLNPSPNFLITSRTIVLVKPYLIFWKIPMRTPTVKALNNTEYEKIAFPNMLHLRNDTNTTTDRWWKATGDRCISKSLRARDVNVSSRFIQSTVMKHLYCAVCAQW